MAKFKKKTINLNGNIYVAEKIIGKGQFGVIYLARSKQKEIRGKKIGKYVAIKEYFVSRFYDPALKANKCDHYWKREINNTKIQGKYGPTLLKYLDSGVIPYENRAEYYIVLSYIEGMPLSKWFSQFQAHHPLFRKEEISYLTYSILIPLAKHLEFCHRRQLIHRDLSVENIFIDTSQKDLVRPVIMDWGASKLLKNAAKDPQSKKYTAFMNKGTPPEIVVGARPIAGSDVYMFGHLMYFLLTGGKTARTPATKEDYVLKPYIDNPQIPKEYDFLVQKCTQYDLKDRFQDISMVIHALEQLDKDISVSKITHFGKSSPNQKIQSPQQMKKVTATSTSSNPFIASSPILKQTDSPIKSLKETLPIPAVEGIRPKPISTNNVKIQPDLQYLKNFELQISQKGFQFAQAFMTYFKNPSWMYLRQDTFQIYQEFLMEISAALSNKENLIRYEKIDKIAYFVGQITGSLHDLQEIIKYFELVFQKAPSTKVIFLGNYINNNSHDIESFTLLLSFYCLYPNNVILLRGKNEVLHAMETKGFGKHLKLKFGAFSSQIKHLFLQIVQSLDLLCITDFNPNMKCLASSGGIPFDPSLPEEICILKAHLKELNLITPSRKEMYVYMQSILWGEPNEFEDIVRSTEKGVFQFSWSYLSNFFRQNHIHYMFRSATEPLGNRVIWNLVNSLNSCAYSRNKQKRISKIIRVTEKGLSTLVIKDLQTYYARDYA
ncbi:Serine/threonine-protein kinase PknD [Candidatus Lokiarchaeum ossiferum]|uniref:protein-serine/threonine phosphatase n=1 Tax=Candidatus Lokiarchaeum ossiferum TaxID=2951803 RepID=A0ABY6HQF8_9ARCH|nr:Serine/threonine-protein kinase PknD [Candidatus Lokiarchaeum sp. B-35]